MRSEDFDYELPATAIAQQPAEPRDASRLLVVAAPLVDTTFAALTEYLGPGDLLVRNATRVRAARLRGVRPTGGAVELLLLDRRGDEWTALAKPARKLKPGMKLDFGELRAEVITPAEDGQVRVRLETSVTADVEEVIGAVGTVPYPPYVEEGPSDAERYQTVYATEVGSAAAPTAGLHFTPALLGRLDHRGVAVADVFLDIGLDTFRPITAPSIEQHVMHSEHYAVPPATWEAITRTQSGGGRVVAVGTTVVRTLESAAVTGELSGSTDLFVQPGYRLRVVDALITNFHMPRSSLLVLLAAMLPNWREVYAHALAEGYRFLSFGDAMLIPEAR
ncbi:MAG: tRNA preQ1(34) S-adenosylmethionine ribosyltransferase-isomerase QueA [Acidimicrobiia bacterium]|nr:tRNA preQ1(34) S-adenosylmethionine ribosyltransferase-isomerase QueA [Acidimicrobiia bacterium]